MIHYKDFKKNWCLKQGMVMRIYFDEDQQIGRCEMGFGDYGDGIVLDWGIEKDGSIRLIRKWQGMLNFFV